MGRMRVGLATLLLSGALTIGSVRAQSGDVQKGAALADHLCSQCHAVAPDTNWSPRPDVPTFLEIALTTGMTSRALTVWLTTFHPDRTMPAIVLDREQREDIIAYILSLREP